MDERAANYSNIDEYIAQFPAETAALLQEMRRVIQQSAPDATEKISYAMPTFALHGNLVHFAAFKRHIGFFPGASGVAAFAEKLEGYKTSKGTIQFSYDKPMPYDLIESIVAYRVLENTSRANSKKR